MTVQAIRYAPTLGERASERACALRKRITVEPACQAPMDTNPHAERC